MPIIATGGPTGESITETIEAGADCISYTPPSTAEIFAGMMEKYRAEENAREKVETRSKLLEALEKL